MPRTVATTAKTPTENGSQSPDALRSALHGAAPSFDQPEGRFAGEGTSVPLRPGHLNPFG